MKKKNWIIPGLVAFLVVAGSFAVGFSSRASVQKHENNPTCCQTIKECTGKDLNTGEMIPGNLSSQFLGIFSFGR